ncbi:hypothetical protein [Chlorobium sp. N1]|uniref:hypothetical protein n=1 Tax=Chlorobium sp. N1 TaxID=2491138 RepID=UPI00103EBF15|nr:hypothetical protein [Chlorobium sp. N1]TCD48447.1 hypothetical protein E0L29_00725 [Chlorobium sp. N1]
MTPPKPYRIVIEWDGSEDFRFSCDYAPQPPSRPAAQSGPSPGFPVMAGAMANVLRKLRREHISFPMFLVALAFNHSRLLEEIDRLLSMLHRHIEGEEGEGRFSCYVSRRTIPPSSSSGG